MNLCDALRGKENENMYISSKPVYIGGIQRVVTTILNELVKNSDFEVTVIMPFQMKGDKLLV